MTLSKSNMKSIQVLTEAIKAVPAVKYALGVAGVAAAVAIVAGLINDVTIAVLGTVIMMSLMFVLVIFAHFVKNAASHYKPLAIFMSWAVVILTTGTSFLIFTGFFFSWPRPLDAYVRVTPVPDPSISPGISPSPQATKIITVETTSEPSRNPKLTSSEVKVQELIVSLLVPSDMSDARVIVNGSPARVVDRLPTWILIKVKPQKENTVIRLIGKRECSPIEQIVSGDQKKYELTINCP